MGTVGLKQTLRQYKRSFIIGFLSGFFLKTNILKNIKQYKRIFDYWIFQQHIPGEVESVHIKFPLSIGSPPKEEMNNFHPHAPEIQYVQDDANTCV